MTNIYTRNNKIVFRNGVAAAQPGECCGACCHGPDCSTVSECECVGSSGEWIGVNASCSPNPCGCCGVGTGRLDEGQAVELQIVHTLESRWFRESPTSTPANPQFTADCECSGQPQFFDDVGTCENVFTTTFVGTAGKCGAALAETDATFLDPDFRWGCFAGASRGRCTASVGVYKLSDVCRIGITAQFGGAGNCGGVLNVQLLAHVWDYVHGQGSYTTAFYRHAYKTENVAPTSPSYLLFFSTTTATPPFGDGTPAAPVSIPAASGGCAGCGYTYESRNKYEITLTL